MIPYVLCLVLLGVGIYAMVAKKNVIKIILGLMIAEYAVNMLLVVVGYRTGGQPPILGHGQDTASFVAGSVDPVAQSVVLISMLVSLSVLLLSVALAVRLYQKYGTFDITEIRKLKG